MGDQIRELGDVLLSENIQSQLPAFNFRPLSSLNLPPATVNLPLARSSPHLGPLQRCMAIMHPDILLAPESLSNQTLSGICTFTAGGKLQERCAKRALQISAGHAVHGCQCAADPLALLSTLPRPCQTLGCIY